MNGLLRRISIAGAVVLLGGVLGMATADAGGNPLTVTPNPVAPGEDFTVSGGPDCIEGSTLTIAVEGETDLVPEQSVSGDEAWSVTFTVPEDAEPGDYSIIVSGEECSFTNTTITVALVESISLEKTVGTTAGECATTSSITVAAGTTVYYCYTVTNDTGSTLVSHSLSDDQLGDVLTDVAQDLAAGASANTVALGVTASAEIDETTTNTATWTAFNGEEGVFSATATATVTVSPDAPPAVAAEEEPTFTG